MRWEIFGDLLQCRFPFLWWKIAPSALVANEFLVDQSGAVTTERHTVLSRTARTTTSSATALLLLLLLLLDFFDQLIQLGDDFIFLSSHHFSRLV